MSDDDDVSKTQDSNHKPDFESKELAGGEEQGRSVGFLTNALW